MENNALLLNCIIVKVDQAKYGIRDYIRESIFHNTTIHGVGLLYLFDKYMFILNKHCILALET